MRFFAALIFLVTLLCVDVDAYAQSNIDSSNVKAAINLRIVIPPCVHKSKDGKLTPNWKSTSGWRYDKSPDGTVTISSP